MKIHIETTDKNTIVLRTNVSDVELNHSNTFRIESLTINNNPKVKNE